MKPQKSTYWMVTIVFSYLLVASILAQLIGNMLGTVGMVQTIMTLALDVGALWVAVQHIQRKSLISMSAATKTVIWTELVFLLLGGGLLAYVSTLPTTDVATMPSMMISFVLTLVVLGFVLYFLLRNAVATSQMPSQ